MDLNVLLIWQRNFMKKNFLIFTIIIITILLLITRCKNQPILARVGNYLVRVEDFRQYLIYQIGNKNLFVTHEQRLRHLNDMVDNKLKLIDAYRHGLEKDPEILETLKGLESRKVLEFINEKEIIEKVITDSLINARYDKMGKQVKIRHIFLPKNENTTTADRNKIKNELKRLRSKIVGGEDFSEIAKTFSRDSLSASNGGDLGYLKWGAHNFGDHFYETAFSMKIGDISHPIETSSGFHLIKVERKHTVEKHPFHELKDFLRSRYYIEKRQELELFEQRFKEKIRKHYQVTFHDENIAFFLSKVQEIRKNNYHKQNTRINLILKDILQKNEQKKPLIEYDETVYTIGKFVTEHGSGIGIGDRVLDSVEKLRLYLDQVIPDDALMIKWGYENDYHLHKKMKDFLREKKEILMIQKIEQLKLNPLLKKPKEEEYKKYYSEHKARYYFPLKVQVQEILLHDEHLAKHIAQRAKENEYFDNLALRYNERILTKRTKGLLGYITQDKYGPIGKKAIKMNIGEISDPIKNEKGFSVIKILDKKSKKQKTYNEARHQVEGDLINTILDSLNRKWLDDLKKNIYVQIFEDNLKISF